MPIHGFDEGKNKEAVYSKDEVDTSLETKVDKIEGKGLSTNDYTNEDKTALANKVDKIEGKGLSTEDYSTAEKAEVAKVQNKQDKHTTASATLLAASWNNKSQTVNVTGVTASNTVIVSAAPASVEKYGACGIICTAQGAGTLTFTCKAVPGNNLTINVVILGV